MMEKKPEISICIPSYNGAEYIRQCIVSCLSQTFHDFELIVVDDGSVDATIAIIEEYAKKDKRLRFFRNEKNLGLVGNWNRCIDVSEGEWIKFVFQDDYLEPDCLQKFMNNMAQNSVLLVSKRSFILPENVASSLKKYYEEGVRTLENTGALENGNSVHPALISKIAADNIALNFIGEPSLTMFRKSIVKEIGYFNPELAQICDFEFFLRIASREGLTYVPEKICHFRIHESSATSANLQSKAYILMHLEPIILVSLMLFDSRFDLLRSYLTPRLKWKLNSFLNVRAYEARLNSSKNKDATTAFNNTVLKFPRIREVSEGSMVTRLKYLLILFRRQIRKIKP